jgi:hypothetical protein
MQTTLRMHCLCVLMSSVIVARFSEIYAELCLYQVPLDLCQDATSVSARRSAMAWTLIQRWGLSSRKRRCIEYTS